VEGILRREDGQDGSAEESGRGGIPAIASFVTIVAFKI
jgi:hypothetical protein